MDKNEMERRLEAAEKQMIGLQDEIANLKAKLDDVQDEEIPEFPTFKGSEAYFFCDAKLDVRRIAFPASETNYVSMDYNAFRTSEYAQLFADKCKLIAMMLHCKWYLDRDYIPDWNNENEEKWQVFWNNVYKRYAVCDWNSDEYGSVFFSTEEKASKAAAWLNAHWKEGTDE